MVNCNVIAYEPFSLPSVIDAKGNASFAEPVGDTLVLSQVFDTNGRMIEKSLSEKLPSAKLVAYWKVSYSYDKDGRRIKVTIFMAADKETNSPERNLSLNYTHKFNTGGSISAISVKKSASNAEIYLDDWSMTGVSIRYETGAAIGPSTSTTASSMIGAKAKVLWNGTWYDATVIEQKNATYKIRYDGYDASWDEWVESERITF